MPGAYPLGLREKGLGREREWLDGGTMMKAADPKGPVTEEENAWLDGAIGVL